MPQELKLIIPCFNEGRTIEANLQAIYAEASKADTVTVRLLAVDDGSTDDTWAQLESLRSSGTLPLEILAFTHNFGKEAAIYAGLQHSADADAAIVIDADLEHPPELIPQMVGAWQNGKLLVEAVRDSQPDSPGLRGFGTRWFYQAMQKLAGFDLARESDFKLLDRAVIEQYLRLPERSRFFKGLIKWIDQPSHRIAFTPPGGEADSNWSLPGLLRYGTNALTSFTAMPLQLVTGVGFLVFLLSAVFLSRALYMKIMGQSVDGFTTVIGLQALFASAIMFSLGIIGSYLGKIYDEVKSRPVYIVRSDKTQLDSSDKESTP
jgi:dolichol-phosphate mannosyltransferase